MFKDRLEETTSKMPDPRWTLELLTCPLTTNRDKAASISALVDQKIIQVNPEVNPDNNPLVFELRVAISDPGPGRFTALTNRNGGIEYFLYLLEGNRTEDDPCFTRQKILFHFPQINP